MKNKTFTFVSLLVCSTLVAISCSLLGGGGLGGGIPGSGNVQTETRHPGAFEVLSIEYPGAEIIVQPGDKRQLRSRRMTTFFPNFQRK